MVRVDGKTVESYLFDSRTANALLDGRCDYPEGVEHRESAISCDLTWSEAYGGSLWGRLPVVHWHTFSPGRTDSEIEKSQGKSTIVYYILETGVVVIPLKEHINIFPYRATPLLRIDYEIDDSVRKVEIRE